MVGPVVYEASVPFFTKALRSQLKLLQKAQEWASTNELDQSKMIAGTLATDMSPLGFHVDFCTYNAMQLLIDLKIVDQESLPIEGEQKSFSELIDRVSNTLEVLEKVTPDSFAEKDAVEVDVFLGSFSLKRDALQYVHEIALPSFWFHHGMVYSILRSQGLPLNKQLFLSAW